MLNEIDLSRCDLNLMVLFEAVMHERHVGRAADRLNLTPSAVSHGLGRLRRQMNDPLFLKTPKGVVPTARATPRATQLSAPIADVLARARNVFSTAQPFDPAKSTRRFTIGAPDGASAVFLPRLLSELQRAAPAIDISVRQLLPPAWHGLSDCFSPSPLRDRYRQLCADSLRQAEARTEGSVDNCSPPAAAGDTRSQSNRNCSRTHSYRPLADRQAELSRSSSPISKAASACGSAARSLRRSFSRRWAMLSAQLLRRPRCCRRSWCGAVDARERAMARWHPPERGMALHTGEAEPQDNDYFGPPLNRVARLLGAGHGAQDATHELVRDCLSPGVALRDMGERRLKDLIGPERV